MIAPHPNRIGLYAVFVALLLSALMLTSSASAGIVPPYDADRELTHLTGRLAPTGGEVSGVWKAHNKGNRLQAP